MLDLNDVYFFVQVIDEKGFAAAARALDLPKSTLSNRVARLEAQLDFLVAEFPATLASPL